MMFTLLLTFILPSLVSSHFQLGYPAVRGFDEDKLDTFPCGGQNSVSSKRTKWPLAGGSIQLDMEHDRSAVQVLLGVGNDVGENFNIVLVPTITEQGEGDFCLGDVVIPESLGLKDGQNATLQVVTNGDPSGGLYNCADITLTSGPPDTPKCNNGTGVTTTEYTGKFDNANGTNSAAGSSSSSSPSSSGTSATGSASPAATKSGSAAVGRADVEWGVLGAVMGGMGVFLGVL